MENQSEWRIRHCRDILHYNKVSYIMFVAWHQHDAHIPITDQTNRDGNLSHFMKLTSCQQTTHDCGDLELLTLVLKLTQAVTGLCPIVLLCPGSAGAHTSHKRPIHTYAGCPQLKGFGDGKKKHGQTKSTVSRSRMSRCSNGCWDLVCDSVTH